MDQSYIKDIFELASRYNTDDNFGYDNAMSGCRDIAQLHARPWEWVASDFEVACNEIKNIV